MLRFVGYPGVRQMGPVSSLVEAEKSEPNPVQPSGNRGAAGEVWKEVKRELDPWRRAQRAVQREGMQKETGFL